MQRISPETHSYKSKDIDKDSLKAIYQGEQERFEIIREDIQDLIYNPFLVSIFKTSLENKSILIEESRLDFPLLKGKYMQRVCTDPLSKEEVISILESKSLILKPEGLTEEEIAKTPSYAPKAIFYLGKCLWTVRSSTYEPVSYEGDCIDTNGCTPEIILTVDVDAKTGEVLYESRERILHPNYE